MSSLKRVSDNTKVTPLRQHIERRNSNNDMQSSAKDFTQDANFDCVLNTQSEISKKIQSKLRVRRATGSQKKLTR